jgi:hypothetical protein
VSLADDHARRVCRGDEIAAFLPGEDLPGWVHQPAGGKFWAPRLVHADGATVMVTCEHGRVRFRALAPDGLTAYHWDTLEITVAESSTRAQLVGHFTRRMATPLLPKHAAAVERLRAEKEAERAKTATCAQLRALIPAHLLDRPWPGDLHDVRWTTHTDPPARHNGRARVIAPDRIDLTIEHLSHVDAEQVITALFTPPAALPAKTTVSSPNTASTAGHADETTAGTAIVSGRLSTPLAHLPVVRIPMTAVPRRERDTLTAAPTAVAVCADGAWLRTPSATVRRQPAVGKAAWAGWPRLHALLTAAARAGAAWVFLDPAAPLSPDR